MDLIKHSVSGKLKIKMMIIKRENTMRSDIRLISNAIKEII